MEAISLAKILSIIWCTRIYLAGIFPFWIGLINLWHKIPGYAWFLIYSSFFCFFFLKFDLWVAKCSHGIRTFSSQINYGVQEGICILFTRISFLCLYDNMEQLIKNKKNDYMEPSKCISVYLKPTSLGRGGIPSALL